MKAGVIHDNHSIFRYHRKKIIFKPLFKKLSVHCASVFKRRNNLITDLTGNNTSPLKFASEDFIMNFLTFRSPTIFALVIGVESGFINITSFFLGNILNLFFEFFYFLWILFLVRVRFFLYVIPSRARASATVDTATPK